MSIKPFAVGAAALRAVSFTGAAFAQEASPSPVQDNYVTVADNQVVTIVCTITGTQTQTNASTQVEEIPVPEAETASESDPEVQSVVQEQNLDRG